MVTNTTRNPMSGQSTFYVLFQRCLNSTSWAFLYSNTYDIGCSIKAENVGIGGFDGGYFCGHPSEGSQPVTEDWRQEFRLAESGNRQPTLAACNVRGSSSSVERKENNQPKRPRKGSAHAKVSSPPPAPKQPDAVGALLALKKNLGIGSESGHATAATAAKSPPPLAEIEGVHTPPSDPSEVLKQSLAAGLLTPEALKLALHTKASSTAAPTAEMVPPVASSSGSRLHHDPAVLATKLPPGATSTSHVSMTSNAAPSTGTSTGNAKWAAGFHANAPHPDKIPQPKMGGQRPHVPAPQETVRVAPVEDSAALLRRMLQLGGTPS